MLRCGRSGRCGRGLTGAGRRGCAAPPGREPEAAYSAPSSARSASSCAARKYFLSGQILQRSPRICGCHGQRYVFQGHGAPNGAVRQAGPRLADVARRAGVSAGTVSNVLNRPATVPERTRERVQMAVADLGYVPTGATRELAAHWRRTGCAAWLFQPAATGWYPRRAPKEAHPVPVLADPWPGVPVREPERVVPSRGMLAAHRARTHPTRAEAHAQDVDGGARYHAEAHGRTTRPRGRLGAGPYSHVTPGMRSQLMAGLTQLWEASLDARAAISPHSPVPVLDELMRARATPGETT